MQINVGKELAALQRLTVAQLRRRYAEVFGEATNANHKSWLIKRIAWRLQAQVEGGLSERARRRAVELANEADLRLSPPKAKPVPATLPMAQTSTAIMPPSGDGRLPPPGTMLTRVYKGQMLQVKVLPRGFEYAGEVYKSLSRVAQVITGQHCNGYLFFRLTGPEASA